MGFASIALDLATSLIEKELPNIESSFSAFKNGDIKQGFTALLPTLKTAAPVIAAASASGPTVPPMTFNLGTPGTYTIILANQTAAK